MTWRVFYSYTSNDAEMRRKLSTHLAPLAHKNKIVEWHDGEIDPGADRQTVRSAELASAHLILLLLSADYLASDYCFGVDIENALNRFKRGEAVIIPVLLRPCLWKESLFSELEPIPRNAKAITSWQSEDEAFNEVASELHRLVSKPPPAPTLAGHSAKNSDLNSLHLSLELVRSQVRSYAHLYEKIRQRMPSSDERTSRMSNVFERMCALATAMYPLLDEFASSPLPGERLAAVAILQTFAAEPFLPFLVQVVSSDKPFVGYQAVKALRFAVGSLDPRAHPKLLEAIHNAQAALNSAHVAFDSDRQRLLRFAEQELRATMESLSV